MLECQIKLKYADLRSLGRISLALSNLLSSNESGDLMRVADAVTKVYHAYKDNVDDFDSLIDRVGEAFENRVKENQKQRSKQ